MRRSVLALVLGLVMAAGCAGKKRPFGEAVPGGDGAENSVNSESDLPGDASDSGTDGVDEEAVGLAPLDQEGPPGVGEGLPGDAVAGQEGTPCDGDAASCVPTDNSDNGSACIPVGPRDCTSDLDNDCDGQPDNALGDVCVCVPESVEPCEGHPGLDGRGQCQAGRRTCILSEDGLSSDWGSCEGSVGPGEQDSCSVAGDDTDCDGINNGGCPCIEGETRPCVPTSEDGICQRGSQTCANGTFGQCVGAVFPAPRNCASNQDNDCDGRIDSTVDNVCTCTIGSVQACGTHPGLDGNGQCQAGSQRCEGRGNNATSTFSNCTGSVGPALQDTCANGNDGNCNGIPNEGCACVNGQTRGCGPDTEVGPCQRGTQTCVNGSFGACQGAVFPAPRNCASAQDNDCDGRPDNTLDDVCECQSGLTACGDTDVDCFDIATARDHCGACDSSCLGGQCLSGVCRSVEIAAGSSHTCIILPNLGVRCWGSGLNGPLGYSSASDIGDNETPASAGFVSTGGNVTQLAAGGGHTCALLSTGNVRCWGTGAQGRLGYGNTNNIGDNELPSTVGTVSVGGSVVQVATGNGHTCALLDTGAVRCWGFAGSGQLGYGNVNNVGDDELPSSLATVNVGGTVQQLAAGGSHTCALLDTGAVRCWGANTFGQLGYGNATTIGDNEAPALAGNVNVGGNVLHITAGLNHTCALLAGGVVRCWGRGFSGELGYGNTDSIGDTETPASAGDVNVGGTVRTVEAGGSVTCALLTSGAVRCWGGGVAGQLGYGSTDVIGDTEDPASVGSVSVGGTVAQITVGDAHTCAFLDAGTVRCWGVRSAGPLGIRKFERHRRQ